MKKVLAIILSALMALTLAACGGTGDSTSSGTTGTTEPSTSTTEGDIVVEKTQAPTEPTTPATEAPAPTDIGEGGYCAVGIVDTAAKTAKVLGDNGVVMSITYEGDDPTPGGVYGFTKNGDAYTLIEATFMNGSALADPAWGLRLNDNTPSGGPDQIYTNDGTNEYLYDFTDDTVVFLRYSATEWRLFKGIDVVLVSEWPCNGYFSVMENPDGGNQLVNLMVVGNYDAASGIVPADVASSFFFDKEGFGWEDGDIIIE